MSYRSTAQVILTALGTAGVYLFGGFDMILQVLIVFIVLDIVTGVMRGVYFQEINSDVYLGGTVKKVGVLILVSMGHMVDQIIEINDPLVRTVVIMTLIGYEGISIIENLAEIGVPIPDKLLNMLEILREEELPQ